MKSLTDGAGADVVYDPVGGAYTEAALRATAWNGRVLVVGFTAGDIPRVPTNLVLLKGCSLVGVFWGQALMRDRPRLVGQIEEILGWVKDGSVRPHVHATYPAGASARRAPRGRAAARSGQGRRDDGGGGVRRVGALLAMLLVASTAAAQPRSAPPAPPAPPTAPAPGAPTAPAAGPAAASTVTPGDKLFADALRAYHNALLARRLGQQEMRKEDVATRVAEGEELMTAGRVDEAIARLGELVEHPQFELFAESDDGRAAVFRLGDALATAGIYGSRARLPATRRSRRAAPGTTAAPGRVAPCGASSTSRSRARSIRWSSQDLAGCRPPRPPRCAARSRT